MASQARYSLNVSAARQGTGELGTAIYRPIFTLNATLAEGTAANQFNNVWADEARTLAATTGDTFDLSGTITNSLGETIDFTKVRTLIVQNNSTHTSCTLSVGPGTTNGVSTVWAGTTPTNTVRPNGGLLLIHAPDVTGHAVTAGSADTIRVYNNGSTTATYTIMTLGCE